MARTPPGGRKGGDPRLRAQRARRGHAKRRGLWGTTGSTGRAHYKGHPQHRTKRGWF